MNYRHEPVLLHDVLHYLSPKDGGRYVDGTLGGAGHAAAILNSADCELLGIDRDDTALQRAADVLAPAGERARMVHGGFEDMARHMDARGWPMVDGILLDLGVSSFQIDDGKRGFSFQQDGPLDMRMNRQGRETASTLINRLTEGELRRLFSTYGEEPRARRIARAIVQRRAERPWTGTGELADLIRVVAGGGQTHGRVPALARCFQAIRIAVNRELDNLAAALEVATERLRSGGRLVIISFHSLEDRLVKQAFRHAAATCVCPPAMPQCGCGKVATLDVLTRRPVTASETELSNNRRAASAKLRAAMRRQRD